MLESLVGARSDLTSNLCAQRCIRVRILFRVLICVLRRFFQISRDIHTSAVYVAVFMEPTSAEVCELSKLGVFLDWVGVPEANAPAIRKEWFSMFGAN